MKCLVEVVTWNNCSVALKEGEIVYKIIIIYSIISSSSSTNLILPSNCIILYSYIGSSFIRQVNYEWINLTYSLIYYYNYSMLNYYIISCKIMCSGSAAQNLINIFNISNIWNKK